MWKARFVGLLLVLTGTIGPATAQEDAVTVAVGPVEDKEILALWVEDVVGNEHPMVRVRNVKVRLDRGTPVRTAATARELLSFGSLLRDDSVFFRVYRGDEGVGIFKYKQVSKKQRPAGGKGTWLEALPLDRDATFRDMTRDARESADIEALLSMDVEEAERAARREEILEDKIAEAIEREWQMLESGEAFLVPTRPSTPSRQ